MCNTSYSCSSHYFPTHFHSFRSFQKESISPNLGRRKRRQRLPGWTASAAQKSLICHHHLLPVPGFRATLLPKPPTSTRQCCTAVPRHTPLTPPPRLSLSSTSQKRRTKLLLVFYGSTILLFPFIVKGAVPNGKEGFAFMI